MKLTIGMIVKNEEKWLDKCLSAIKPILDNVDSELIITDTGSTDKTVEIAKKYTDKVLHFDWVNDFSAARNFGLAKAQGEWFMMLDADDIFQSCKAIIEFFNSGEYHNYNSATYISRNLFNTNDLSSYSDMRAMRLTRVSSDTKYLNVVHEYLNTFGEPIKNIDDVALHYGYAVDGDVNILEKKQDRNSELLLKRLETEGETNELLYVQLFECYSAMYRHEEAYNYLEKGRELCIKNNSIVLAVIYAEKARLLFRNGEYENVLNECDSYFLMDKKIHPHTLTSDAEMFYLRSASYQMLGLAEESFSDLCRLFDIYPDVLSGKLATPDAYMQSYEFATERNYLPALCDLIRLGSEMKNFDAAEKYLMTSPVSLLKKSDDNVRRRLRLSVAGLFLTTGSRNLLSVLKYIIPEEKYFDEYIALYSNYDNVTSGDITEYAIKRGINENPDLIALMMKKRFDITALFESNTDLKRCAYECCKFVAGFYGIAENYAAVYINKPEKLQKAAEFIGNCISVRLLENEGKPQECKEQLIQPLFRLKSGLNERYKRECAAAEFERLAAAIKQNIRMNIDAGNTDAAKKTIDEYKKIAKDDPELDELIKKIQVET